MRLSHDLNDCQDKLCALRKRVRDLEVTPSQPTFAAVVAASGDKPLTPSENWLEAERAEMR